MHTQEVEYEHELSGCWGKLIEQAYSRDLKEVEI
jgi:hypothetical protein